MKKNVGMTIAQKSKETMVGMKDGNGINLLFCISSQQSLHISRVASDYSAVMYVYVGIVGWIEQRLIPFPSFIPTLVSFSIIKLVECVP